MIDFGRLVHKASKYAIDHSPTILTSIGVAGVVTTAVLAAKASWQAADIIRLKEASDEERGEALEDPREILKDRIDLVWRLYIGVAATAVVSIACIIGAQRVNNKRAAALAAAYSLAGRNHSEYVEKVREKFGDRKEEQVRTEVAQDRMDEVYLDDVRLAGIDRKRLVYDIFGDRFFEHTVEGIRSAMNDFNRMMLHDGNGCLGDFYRMLDPDASTPAFAENVGWNSDKLMEVLFSTTLLHGEIPVITIEYKPAPDADYGRFRGW